MKYLGTVAGLYGGNAERVGEIEQYVEAVRDAADGVSKQWWSTPEVRKSQIPTLIKEGGM